MQNKVHDHPTAPSIPHGSSIAWLGLDAHAQNCTLAQLDDDGTQRRFWRIPTQADKLVAQVQAIAAPDKRLALEESNLARWLWQLLRPHVAQLVVCDARHNKLISSHPNKKDARDAFGLARLFRLNELKPVWQLPSDERALFECAAQSYEEAVLRQTQLKQHFPEVKLLSTAPGLGVVGAHVFAAYIAEWREANVEGRPPHTSP